MPQEISRDILKKLGFRACPESAEWAHETWYHDLDIWVTYSTGDGGCTPAISDVSEADFIIDMHHRMMAIMAERRAEERAGDNW